MRDFLPDELSVRNQTMAKIKSAYAKFGFTEIETPILEDIDLLLSKEGGENEKLIYKVLKRGEKLDNASGNDLCDLGLRFDLTVPLSRYCANNAGNLPPVFKAMQVGNVFRAERPQKGRFRQFVQCDIDIIGEESYIAEIDLICATVSALTEVGLEGFTVRINDRRILTAIAYACGYTLAQHEKVFIALDKLDKIGFEGVDKELEEVGNDEGRTKLLSILHAVDGSDDKLTALESQLADQSVSEVISQLRVIMNTAKKLSHANMLYDVTLVRGMNYYTGTIFEVAVKGVPYSVAGGGRYDELLGKITGVKTCACGFSIGFERICGVLAEKSILSDGNTEKTALIFNKDDVDKLGDLDLVLENFRSKSQVVSIFKKNKNFQYQIKSLSACGYGSVYLYNGDGTFKEIN